MFGKIKKLNLLLFLSPELIAIAAAIIFLCLGKHIKLFLIIAGSLSVIYAAIFVMFFIVSKSIDKWNKKVLGENTDTSALIKLSPAQMRELMKGHGVKDPNSDKIITLSEISEVK